MEQIEKALGGDSGGRTEGTGKGDSVVIDREVDPETTPSVQYTYSDGASGGIAKYARLTSVEYPNTRLVHYTYGTTGHIWPLSAG